MHLAIVTSKRIAGILLLFALNVDNISFYFFFAIYLCSGIYRCKTCPECLCCWHLSILKSSYNWSFCCLVAGLWHPDVGELIIWHFKDKNFKNPLWFWILQKLWCVFFLSNILLCISSEGLLEDDFSLFNEAKNIVSSNSFNAKQNSSLKLLF